MNEQIKHIAIKAQLEHCVSHVRLQEFAELIAQECISVLDKRFMGDLNREDMEVRRCIEAVKTHFGIDAQ